MPKATDVKVFVPAKNFDISRDFYVEAGWKLIFEGEGIAELELGKSRFYLQDFYVKDWANNFMLYVDVQDAQVWFEHMRKIVENKRYKPARVKVPEKKDHGALVAFAWDPSGVLIHFAQPDP